MIKYNWQYITDDFVWNPDIELIISQGGSLSGKVLQARRLKKNIQDSGAVEKAGVFAEIEGRGFNGVALKGVLAL